MSQAEDTHTAIRCIYEAALEPDKWLDAIGAIVNVTGASKGMLHAESDHAPTLALPFGFEAQQANRLRREFEQRMPAWIDAIPLGTAMRQSSGISDADFRRSDIYIHAIRPIDGFYGMVAPLIRRPDQQVVFSVGRDLGVVDFGDDDHRALNYIVPHLMTALRVRNRLAAADLKARGACEVAMQLDFGVVLLDAFKRPIFANGRAEAIARGRDGLLLSSQRVSATSSTDSRRLDAAISTAITFNDKRRDDMDVAFRPRATMRCSVSRTPPRPALILQLVPVSSTSFLDGGDAAGTRAVVLVIEPDRLANVQQSLLEDTFGLTHREASLASLLARGADLSQAAAEAGITNGTARGYLKQILAKTDTHRQAELVALMLRSGLQFVR
jgi:DNA-binding CsgD family transcriptional regulator